MDNKRFTAMFLVITMLLAGCLNADPDVDVPLSLIHISVPTRP